MLRALTATRLRSTSSSRLTIPPGVCANTRSKLVSTSVSLTISVPADSTDRSGSKPATETNRRRPLGRAGIAPHNGGDPQQQFARLERLGQIVVGPGLK